MVEAEATIAEAESEEEVEEGDEPLSPGHPQPEPESEDEPEAAFDPKRFEVEQTRHEKALAKTFGAAWSSMGACSECGGVGYLPEDFTPPPEIKADPTLVVCTDCNGYGQRTTPSLHEQYAFVPCTACSGSGYRDKDTLAAMQQAAAYSSSPSPPAPPPMPVWNTATQQWETPDGRVLGVSEPYAGSRV
jgi:hypothetical protein